MITAQLVAELRARTGAGMVECKKALEETGGDLEKAMEVLRKSGAAKAAKKTDRNTAEGVVHAYIHSNEKVGALVELQCETDFVARTQDFKDLAHEIAMQVAATDPAYVSPEAVPDAELAKLRSEFEAEIADDNLPAGKAGKPDDIKAKIVEGKIQKWLADATLLKQPWVKDDSKTMEQLVNEKIATIGEKIVVARIVRFQI